MQRFTEAAVYLVTSRSVSGGRETTEIVRAALAAGVRLVQLREKELNSRQLLELALEVRGLTSASGALLIVNDRLDIALAAGADGVHLGQEDLPVDVARGMAPDLVIGASTHSAAEAREARDAGASYVNIGPLFPTSTKTWGTEFLGIKGLKEISKGVSIPFTVMGGIKREHVPDLLSAGARTIAVVSAVTAAADPEQAARELLEAVRGGRDR